MNARLKKSIEEWNDGTLEYRVEKKYFHFYALFQPSIIPE